MKKNIALISGLFLILLSLTCLTNSSYYYNVKLGDTKTYFFKGNFNSATATIAWNSTNTENLTINNGTTFKIDVCKTSQISNGLNAAAEIQLTIDNLTTGCNSYNFIVNDPFFFNYNQLNILGGVSDNKSVYSTHYNSNLGVSYTLNNNNYTYMYNVSRTNYELTEYGSTDINTGWLLSQGFLVNYNNGTKIYMVVIQLNASPISSSPGFDVPSLVSIFLICYVIKIISKKER